MKTTEKACVPTGREREDRALRWKYAFDPSLGLDVRQPDTAVLLLRCEEKPVLLAAATALSRYAERAKENAEYLFDLEIVQNLTPLIEHEDPITQRFAAKLLAELVVVPSVADLLLDQYLPYLTKTLIEEERDWFVQESCSAILAAVSRSAYGAAMVSRYCLFGVDSLLEHIQNSPDPDVRRNCIELVRNLMRDSEGAVEIINAKNFDLAPMYRLLRDDPYLEIKLLVLDLICGVLRRSGDENARHLFLQSAGPRALLRFFQDNVDSRTEALEALRLACEHLEIVEAFDLAGAVPIIFAYLEDAPSRNLFLLTLDVLTRFAGTPFGRKSLYSHGIVEYLSRALRDSGTTQPDVREVACRGIAGMSLHAVAASEFVAETGTIHVLTDISKDERAGWSVREAALFALEALCLRDEKDCAEFLNIQGERHLLRLLSLNMEEIRVAALRILLVIARYPSLRPSLTNVSSFTAVSTAFRSKHDETKIAVCQLLSLLCVDEIGSCTFLEARMPEKLHELLTGSQPVPVRDAATRLVLSLSKNPRLAAAFVEAKYLPYMWNDRLAARAVPSWEGCVNALLAAHLPIKFALTGRLGLCDVTKDGFYAVRRNVCRTIPILEDVFRFQFCPLESVYVANAVSDADFPDGDSRLEVEESISRTPKGIFLSTDHSQTRVDSKYGRLQSDPDLRDLIELFRCELVAMESKNRSSRSKTCEEEEGIVEVPSIAARAQKLGKFVVRHTSGPDPHRECTQHRLEMHLKEIKIQTETNVIPLGLLRVGSYLERALLFKVIADRITLPAALVRGEYGRAWIEVAVPRTEAPPEKVSLDAYSLESAGTRGREPAARKEEPATSQKISASSEDDDRRCSNYPAKLLRPNFIVDLMDDPGCLLPIESERAKEYRAGG